MHKSRYRDLLIVLPVIAFFLCVLFLSGTTILTRDLGEFVLAGGMVAPFVILALLAYTGETHPWVRHLATLWLMGILFVLFAITVMLTIAPVVTLAEDEGALETYLDSLPPATVGWAFLVSLLAAAAGLIGFSRRIRGQLSRVLPFNPDSHIHSVALCCVLALIAMPLVPLLLTGNAPFLNPELQAVLGIGLEEPGSTVKLDTFSLIWTVIGSFFLVGLFVRRDIRGTLERLGLVRPTLQQVAIGIASGILLVTVFWFFDEAVVMLFTAWGIPTTDETMVNNLFMVSFTPLAAVIASISAGLGEELSVRGVIQPRFGILVSALVFTSLHAYQYAWDGLLSVLLVGICFGILRKYTNTSTSAISHGVYDLVLFALIIAGITTL
ncbi:MAG: CPBP family intramembrane metalloprotease domain-containing protein [Methanomicrobiales archaeon HGW-Methanomicrobiales-3]|nr:MAG: CPBP family intramembrane metalloprotease domain-containing protein [Methanomicrobiales archaeon HGW-Methanomicrobiales-3]